jgi:hypothetical protein
MTDLPVGRPLNARHATMKAFVEDCRVRFPDVASPWLHQSEDGTRIWLTDGQDGPVLAMTVLPVARDGLEEGA